MAIQASDRGLIAGLELANSWLQPVIDRIMAGQMLIPYFWYAKEVTISIGIGICLYQIRFRIVTNGN